MEIEEAILLLLIASMSYVLLTRRMPRRYAVRPINRCRRQKGLFNNLLTAMVQEDQEMFFKYTRMTTKMFFYLLSLVENKLIRDPSRHPLPPAHRLIITLQ